MYTSGVVSGALSSHIFETGKILIGGSAGCYALVGAQLASITLNWHEDHAIVIR